MVAGFRYNLTLYYADKIFNLTLLRPSTLPAAVVARGPLEADSRSVHSGAH
jgi:hypothetical protein